MRSKVFLMIGAAVLALMSALVLSAVFFPQLALTRGVRRAIVKAYRGAQGHPLEEPAVHARIPVSSQQLREGRQSIRAAMDDSRIGSRYHIVVDKTAYSLFVYLDGSPILEFPVELGFDPVPAKEREGDGRTPEGSYTVAWRLEKGATTFHLALLLDYPNAADREAGRTGSEIEIHGEGSGARPGEGGSNWTLGCIALSNPDVEALFALESDGRRIGEGTPVTVVHCGSLPDEQYVTGS